MKRVKKLLAEAELKIKEKKSRYYQKKLKYLGFILTTEEIQKNSQKAEIIKKWEVLKNQKKI